MAEDPIDTEREGGGGENGSGVPTDEDPAAPLRRSNRRAAARRGVTKTPSASMYLGYVEDEESIESIVKKFEALEEYQREKRDGKVEKDMNEKDYEDLFQLTSAFSVEAVLKGNEVLLFDTESLSEEGDEDAFSDTEADGREGRRRGKSGKEGAKEKRLVSTRSIQKTGVIFMGLGMPRLHEFDMTQPTYVKIPRVFSEYVAKKVEPYRPPQIDVPGSCHIETNLYSYDFSDIKGKHLTSGEEGVFDAVLINPPYRLGNKNETAEDLRALDCMLKRLQPLLPRGYIFCWVQTPVVKDIMQLMRANGFRYVEAITWVRKNIANSMILEQGSFLWRAKQTCLIFRKMQKNGRGWADRFDMRHQRNADVILQFVPADTERRKPEKVVTIMETLLPDANFNEETGRGRFLELFAMKDTRRRGWTTIAHTLTDK